MTGAGFHSFKAAGRVVGDVPAGSATALAHNGFLQAAADGGLVLALPLVCAAVAVAVALVRGLPSAVREADPSRLAAASVPTALVLHSSIDIDWSYPTLLCLAAMVAVLCSSPAALVRPGRLAPVAAVIGTALLVFAAVAAWGGGLHLSAELGLQS